MAQTALEEFKVPVFVNFLFGNGLRVVGGAAVALGTGGVGLGIELFVTDID